MGLKFCNEAVIALKQLWPKSVEEEETLIPLQVCLIRGCLPIDDKKSLKQQSITTFIIQNIHKQKHSNSDQSDVKNIQIN
jgi:hypothetical protein